MTADELLTEEARTSVLRALLMIVLNEDDPASARVAAARLLLSQFAVSSSERDVLVVVDEAL